MNRRLVNLRVADEADTTGEVVELPGLVRVVAVMRIRDLGWSRERLHVVYEQDVDHADRVHRVRLHVVGNGGGIIPAGAVLLKFAAESGIASYIEHLPDDEPQRTPDPGHDENDPRCKCYDCVLYWDESR